MQWTYELVKPELNPCTLETEYLFVICETWYFRLMCWMTHFMINWVQKQMVQIKKKQQKNNYLQSSISVQEYHKY